MKCLSFLLILFSLTACGNAKQESADATADSTDSTAVRDNTTTDSLSWIGMYKGTVPCADCPGIETTLMLNADSTFSLALVYIDAPSKAPIKADGRFRWTPGTNTVILDGLLNQPNQYSVGQNMLMQMDMTGQPITGPNAARYILMKQNLQVVTSIQQ